MSKREEKVPRCTNRHLGSISSLRAQSYNFVTHAQCNMCNGPLAKSRVLGFRLNGRQGWLPRRKAGIAVSVCQCPECGLIFCNPMPIPARTQDHYGVEPEHYWSDEYFQIGPEYFRAIISNAFRKMHPKERPKALDVGAGIGKAMIAMERAGFDVWGIEPSAPFRDRAVSMLGIATDRLQLAGIADANFPPGVFDFINFGAVLEHLPDPAYSIDKALMWLRPGGLIHIEVPSSNYLIHNFLNILYRLMGTNFVGNLSPMHPPYHLYEFDLRSFRSHGNRAGYRVEEWHFEPASGRFVPRAIYPLLYRWMQKTGTGMQLTVWLRKLELAG